MHTTSPLSALRHWLEASQLDGMIVPRADAWQSEYCAPYDEKLAWLTGFDGSAGVALVLKNKALLFVDGRSTPSTVMLSGDFDIAPCAPDVVSTRPFAAFLTPACA